MKLVRTRAPGPGRAPIAVLLGTAVVVLLGACGGSPAGAAEASDTYVVPNATSAHVKGRLELNLTAAPPAGYEGGALPLSGCFVRPPGARNFTKLPPEKPAPADVLRFLGSYPDGLCGVRVQPVTRDHEGTWALRAEFNLTDFPKYAASASAVVTVSEFSDAVTPDKPSVTEGGQGFTLRLQLLQAGLQLSDCVVTPPGGAAVTLAPAAPAGRLQYYSGEAGGTLERGWCAVRVEGVQTRDHGQWVLEATVAATGVVRRAATNVHVFKLPVSVSPRSVTAELGETAVLKLVFATGRGTAPLWTGCQVVTPAGALLQLSGSGPRSGAQEPQGDGAGAVRLAGEEGAECGVQVGPLTADQVDAGGHAWTLVGEVDGVERAAAARVFVKAPYTPAGVVSRPVLLGARGVPLTCGPADAVSCELRDPGGALAASFTGPCVHTLERTRASHNGTWTCSALLADYSEPVEDTYVLTLVEPVRVVTGVTGVTGVTAGAGAVVLQCRLAGARACPSALAYCRMDSPAGERHLIKEGVLVNKGRLSYAGAGLDRCDCSVALRGPLQPEDYGVWRCILGVSSTTSRRGALIPLSRAAGARGARDADAGAGLVAVRTPPDGVVAPGGVATVGCRAQRPLSYCWLRTPRGELLAVSESLNRVAEAGDLRYHGLGLEVGECGVRIASAAPANHSGTWRCGVGTVGDGGATFDQEVPVDLIVSASQFVPLAANVSSPTGHAATLGCRTLLSDALEYCRFLRPDGVSVHLADAGVSTDGKAGSRYRYLEDDGRGLAEGYCRLVISSVADEDYGQWTCAVRFAGDAAGQEHTAFVTLETDGLASASVVGGAVAAAVVLLAAASFVGYRRCRSRLGPRRRSPSMSASETSDAPISASAAAVSRSTRASARLAAAALPSTRLPARLRGASARAADEAISLEALPRPRPRPSPATTTAAPDDSSGSEDHTDIFPASSRKRQ